MKVNQVKCWFLRRGEGKLEYPEKTSRCRVENQQTQPTYDAESRNRTRATLVGGDCSHHCAIPAPQSKEVNKVTFDFILNHKPAKIKKTTLIKQKAAGGLDMKYFSLFDRALKLN